MNELSHKVGSIESSANRQVSLRLKIGARKLMAAVKGRLATLLRAMPGAWRILGLPRKRIRSLGTWVDEQRSSRDWMENIKGTYFERVQDPLAVSRFFPLRADAEPLHRAFSIERFHVYNEIFFARIPGARILGPNGVVITADGSLVEQSTWGSGWLERDRALTSIGLRPPSFEAGNYYTVACPFSEGYAHWLLDVLPRLFALERLPADEMRVIVSGALNSWQRESLRMLGVKENQTIALGNRYLQLETLYLPSYVGDPGNPHPWGCEWLRTRLLSSSVARVPRRRVFISRRNAIKRRIVNEDELETTLSLHGFEIIESDKLSFADEVRLFSEAEAIVGPHGAGITNALFAPEGCRILEIFDPQDVKANNYALADILKHEYWYLVGQQAGDTRGLKRSTGHEDIYVPVADLSRSLKAMLKSKATMVAFSSKDN